MKKNKHGVLSLQKKLSTEESFSPSGLFHAYRDAFQKAQRTTCGSIDKFFSIAGYIIQLKFADHALIPLITKAFQHLAIEPQSQADLTICLWDSASTGIKISSLSLSRLFSLYDTFSTQGKIYNPHNQHNCGIHIAVNPNSQRVSVLNIQTNLAFFNVVDCNQLELFEIGAPLISVLNRWMNSNKRQILHAGAVGTDKGCVLLAGQGGSGKSTTSLICFNTGLHYLSDDHCIVSLDMQTSRKYYAHSIYNSAKLNKNCVYTPLGLKPAMENDEKYLYFLHKYAPERIISSLPIQAILIPTVTNNRETKLISSSAAMGLKALAPSTMLQLAGSDRKSFQYLVNLVKTLPCYIIELGTDLKEIPIAINEFIG